MADTKISALSAATFPQNADLFVVCTSGLADVSETFPQVINYACCRQHAANTLTTSTANVKIFNATTNGAVTLPIGAYLFDSVFSISVMTGTSGNCIFDLKGAGNATLAGILYICEGADVAIATAGAGGFSGAVQSASAASMIPAATGTGLQVRVAGSFEVTVAGTIIPSVGMVTGVSTAPSVAIGSFFRVWPMGPAATTVSVGNWS